MLKEHQQIVLTAPAIGDEQQKLQPGDIGTIIHIHPNQKAFVAEFTSPDGETIAIATVLPSQARPAIDTTKN